MSVVVLENTHEIKCIFKQAVLIRRNRMEKEPPLFLDIHNGRIAQCDTEIDCGSYKQAGER